MTNANATYDPTQGLTGFLYEARPEDRLIFQPIAEYLQYPEKFPHSNWTPIAVLPGEKGQRTVLVYESRCPASFYKVIVMPGAGQPGVIYQTGSGDEMGRLAAEVAKAWHETGGILSFALALRVTYENQQDMFVPQPWQSNCLG